MDVDYFHGDNLSNSNRRAEGVGVIKTFRAKKAIIKERACKRVGSCKKLLWC